MHGFFSKLKGHAKSGSSENQFSSKTKNEPSANTHSVNTSPKQSCNPIQVKKESIQTYKTSMGSHQVLSTNIISSNTSSNITFTKIIYSKPLSAKIASQPQEDRNNLLNESHLGRTIKSFESKQLSSITKNDISTNIPCKSMQESYKYIEPKILDLKTLNLFTNKENKANKNKNSEFDVDLFDPDPAREEKDTFNKIIVSSKYKNIFVCI